MKTRFAIVCLLLGAASAASAIEPLREAPREKALMLYFSKSFGGPAKRLDAPMNFGLRLQQSAAFDAARPLSLVDMRYSLDGRGTLALAGVSAVSLKLALGEEEGADSSGNSSSASTEISIRHPGWTAAGIVAALFAGACSFEWGICEDDKKEYSRTETPGPTGPG
jgi:hypothetical protein